MRAVVLFALGSALLSGCIVFGESEQRFDATWELKKLDGSAAACGTGDVAHLSVWDLEAAAIVAEESFPCDGYRGLTGCVDPGFYGVALELRREDGSPFAQRFRPDVELLADQDTCLPFDVLVDGAFVSLQWSITSGGTPTECSNVGAASVELRATPLDSGAGFTRRFECAFETESFGPEPLGSYSMSLVLLDGSATPVELDTVDLGTVSLTVGGGTVDLGETVFAL